MLEDFYLLDEDGTPVLDDEMNNVLMSRPETKTQADLDRVIGLGKPSHVVSKFADMVALGDQWDWLESYLEWEVEVADIEEYNENLPVVALDEDGITPVHAEPKETPLVPIRPDERTGADVLAPYARGIFKKDRTTQVANIKVEVDGMIFDGDEDSQTRMARAVVTLDDGESVLWVLANNEVANPTRDQLKQALRLSGEAQANIWVMD